MEPYLCFAKDCSLVRCHLLCSSPVLKPLDSCDPPTAFSVLQGCNLIFAVSFTAALKCRESYGSHLFRQNIEKSRRKPLFPETQQSNECHIIKWYFKKPSMERRSQLNGSTLAICISDHMKKKFGEKIRAVLHISFLSFDRKFAGTSFSRRQWQHY